MAHKPAHKVLGIELRYGVNITLGVADPISGDKRDTLTWAGLSGAQQAQLEQRNKRRLGQASG